MYLICSVGSSICDIGGGLRERRRNITIPAAPAPARQTATNQAQNNENSQKNTTIRIKTGPVKIQLFPQIKNRRMTLWEEEQEKEDARIWKRPRRAFIFDPPTYPWCPPEPMVNFDLGYFKK